MIRRKPPRVQRAADASLCDFCGIRSPPDAPARGTRPCPAPGAVRGSSAMSSSADTKACPFCGEQILRGGGQVQALPLAARAAHLGRGGGAVVPARELRAPRGPPPSAGCGAGASHRPGLSHEGRPGPRVARLRPGRRQLRRPQHLDPRGGQRVRGAVPAGLPLGAGGGAAGRACEPSGRGGAGAACRRAAGHPRRPEDVGQRRWRARGARRRGAAMRGDGASAGQLPQAGGPGGRHAPSSGTPWIRRDGRRSTSTSRTPSGSRPRSGRRGSGTRSGPGRRADYASKRFATSSSITSVAPPPIASTRASRTSRSIGLSRM